jgi:modulator of FtsH protease HflK
MNFDKPPGQFPEIRIPPIDPGLVIKILIGLVVVIVLLTSVFTVEPEEAGLVTQFGRYVRQAPPGLNLKLPFPIEQVIKVPVERQLKEEFGFRTVEAGIQSIYNDRGQREEAIMLTGDLNVAIVEWTAQYRVRDPYSYLFKVREVRKTFRDMNETVMREVIGDRSVNEILTIGRQEIASEVEVRLQALCDQYENGIRVEQIVLQDVNPPDTVKPSFNEVNQAQQEKERMINEARSEYNQVIPRARGRALQTIEQAEGFAINRVNRAEGDVELFVQLYNAYSQSPDVTRRRIYLETMAELYPKIKQKIIIDDQLRGVLPLLPLQGRVQQ